MFSRKEAFEYFNKYDWSKVELLLLESGFDPEAKEFPPDAIEKVEQTFGAVEGVAKRLSGAKNSSAIAIKNEASIVQQGLAGLDIAVPVETLVYLVKGAISEYENAALMIHDAGQTAFARTLSNQQEMFFKSVAQSMQENTDKLNEVFSSEAIQKFVDKAIPEVKKFDVDAFLEEQAKIKKQTEKLKSRTTIKKVDPSEPFDIDGFLDEMNKKMEKYNND